MTATPPSLQVLLAPRADADATGPAIAPDPAEQELLALYDRPAAEHGTPVLRANMITSLDGSATGADGRSGTINGPADLRVFTVLRALADVILVGAGTVRAEGYRAPRVRPQLVAARQARGLPDHPGLAVVSRSGDVPVEVLDATPAPWVFTTTAAAPHLTRLADHLPADRLHVDDDDVDLPGVLDRLAAAGRGQILTEGGPVLLGHLLHAGLVDELCLTTAPVLVGGDAARVVDVGTWFRPPRAARLRHLLHADGVLLARWSLPRQ